MLDEYFEMMSDFYVSGDALGTPTLFHKGCGFVGQPQVENDTLMGIIRLALCHLGWDHDCD